MDLSGDDANAGFNPRQKRQVQDIHLTVEPVQVNVTQAADPQVLKKLDELLAAIKETGADRAKLAQITSELKTHTDALKQAADAAKTP